MTRNSNGNRLCANTARLVTIISANAAHRVCQLASRSVCRTSAGCKPSTSGSITAMPSASEAHHRVNVPMNWLSGAPCSTIAARLAEMAGAMSDRKEEESDQHPRLARAPTRRSAKVAAPRLRTRTSAAFATEKPIAVAAPLPAKLLTAMFDDEAGGENPRPVRAGPQQQQGGEQAIGRPDRRDRPRLTR